MAKDPASKPDARVIDALNGVYVVALQALEQFHRQKNRFKVRYRYKVLVHRFDGLTCHAHDWRHELLMRLERLGGDADSVIPAGAVTVADDVKPAFAATLELLDAIATATEDALEVVRDARDTPSRKALMAIAKDVDHQKCKVEAWIRQATELGENYLIALIK